ncbi:carbamate kinase [Desulfosporosinus nitroreducens]|uniref:Carbamate kinase n=1 Tax=Desulfosporosinus nitroreducens TaxID=2018668 RepID=A0ABT8QMU2_9FIRM|nr:carbamate kinase [Desulfosporosinus nitroreducens]MCO1603942.1 carbamate kinase [Desulfosporosinus nitroreducens]MDO0822560.1 carbamate kinase [Desulfosporosinus nitroreducens]
MSTLAVVAIGGNSLIRDNAHESVEDQYQAVVETAKHIVGMIEQGYEVIVTHGNGPQVGFILRRSEIAKDVAAMHQVPLVSCGADTQGAIGYQIQQAMDNEFKKRGMDKTAVTIVTQVVVSENDPAFQKPTKPIGSFYTKEQTAEIQKANPSWVMIEDAGRGYRRMVASPLPQEIVEKNVINKLVRDGYCVISVGGGGIPVIKSEDGSLRGVDAVIDKDFATSLLAADIKADVLIISTGVPTVYLNYGKPNEKALDKVTLAELKQYVAENHFAPGSMLPKIQAVISFLENGGKEAIITNPESLEEAVAGKTGTHIYP